MTTIQAKGFTLEEYHKLTEIGFFMKMITFNSSMEN